MATTGILDLEQDALVLICTLLPVRDLCSFSQACRRSRGAAQEEHVWEVACSSLIHENPAYQRLCAQQLPCLKAWMGAPSYKKVYKVLTALGCWPEGVWRSKNPPDGPQGALLHVTCAAGACFRVSRMRNEREQVQKFVLVDAHTAFCCYIRGHSGIVEVLLGRQQADGQLELKQILQRQNASSRPRDHQSYAFCCPVPAAPWPASLPDLEQDASNALARLQGVWKAKYGGPHGTEYIQVSMVGEATPPPPGCPVTWERLEGFKITGDPNVPAGQHTFVIPCRGAVLGRCDRRELQDSIDGPIVVDGALQTDNVLSRPVAARFQGFAQINYDPGRWAPQWIRVQLLTYEGTRPLFSILWSYPRSGFRELMDFAPLPVESQGLSSMHAPE